MPILWGGKKKKGEKEGRREKEREALWQPSRVSWSVEGSFGAPRSSGWEHRDSWSDPSTSVFAVFALTALPVELLVINDKGCATARARSA